ncbi:MAG: hypothetical protein ACK500_03185 [Flavobacteriales bacterium]
MDVVVDTYARVLIAILGFIAPTVTLIWSFLQDGIRLYEKRIREEESNLELISKDYQSMKEAISKSLSSNDENFQRKLNDLFNPEEDRKNAKHRIEKLNKIIYRLNIKYQIKYVFSFLLLSLSFAMCLQYCIGEFGLRVLKIPYYYLYISAFSILSVLFAFLAVKRIWEFLCLIIETKENIEENKAKEAEGTPIRKKNLIKPIVP